MFSSVVRGGSGVCAHDWKLHADPYRFILQLMLPRMAISHPASYKDFSYSTCFWEISSRIQGRHAIVNLPPNINIELNKSSFANIHRDTNWIYIYIYTCTHTHLLRTVIANFVVECILRAKTIQLHLTGRGHWNSPKNSEKLSSP